MSLPQGAVDQSVVCDCGISLSYSLPFTIFGSYTHVTNDNRDTALSTSNIYDILFNVKIILHLLEMVE